MSRKKYDAVVLGAGVGGLTAAGYLAKAGIKPLVLEKTPRVGGRMGSTIYQGYAIDQIIFISHKILLEVLDELGIKVNFYQLPPNPIYIQPLDKISSYPVLSDVDGLASLLGQPRDAVAKYKEVFESLCRMDRRQTAKLKKVRLIDWLPADTWRKIKPVLSADFQFRPWAIKPNQIPELSVGEIANILTSGGPTESAVPQPKLYPADPAVGGIQAISEGFAGMIRRNGGEIRTRCIAVEARIEEGAIAGVSFLDPDGVIEEVDTPLVVSDVPIWYAFDQILDKKQFPAEMVANARALARWETETMNLAVALNDLPKRRSDGKKEDNCRWCRFLLGNPGALRYGGGYILTTIGSPASAPKGKHLINHCRCLPRGTISSPAKLRALAEEGLGVLRHIYSNLDEVMDWWRILPQGKSAPIHASSTIDRPAVKTDIKGLYLVGDTTESGDGRPYCLDGGAYSGRVAGKMIAGGK